MQNCQVKIFPVKPAKFFPSIFLTILLFSLAIKTGKAQEEANSHFPEMTLIAPRQDARIESQTPLILISLFDADDDINPETVTLKIDNIDVSDSAQISRTLVSFVPRKEMKKGKHIISIVVSDSLKNRTGPLTWNFFISPKEKTIGKVPSIHGRIEFQSNFNFFPAEKPAYYRPHDTQLFRLNLNKKIRDWSLAISTTQRTHFAGQDRLVDKHYQPFNRFQFCLQKRNFQLHIGDVVSNFSLLTLANNRIRGVSLFWRYKSFSTRLIQGQLHRAVVSSNLSQMQAYSRNIFGAALGFHFLSTFKLTVNLIKIKDVSSSYSPPDSGFYRLLPAGNLVISSQLEYLSTDGKTEFSAEAAHSVFIFNNECRQQKTLFKGLKENIPPWLIKINDCYITTFSRKPLENFAPPTYQFSLRRRFRYSNLAVKFSRIPLAFTTLGNQNLPLNSQQLEISSLSNLYANKIFLALNFSNGKNNLMPHISSQKTRRKRIHFNINYAINSSLSLQAGVQKFSQKTTENLFKDHPIANSDFNLLNIGATLQVHSQHQIFFNFLRSASKVQSENVSDFQSLSFSTRHHFAIPLSLGLGIDYTENKLQGDLSFKYTDIHWNLRYNFAEASGQIFLSGNIYQIEEASGNCYRRFYFSATSTIQLQQKFSLVGRVNYFASDSGYSMAQISLGIQRTF